MRDTAFTHFHDRFKTDPLVLDKWMGLQAASPLAETPSSVRALMKHPAFRHQESQPGARPDRRFRRQSLCRFHSANGEGYRLVGEVIRTLDPLNPQVAARLAGAWKAGGATTPPARG